MSEEKVLSLEEVQSLANSKRKSYNSGEKETGEKILSLPYNPNVNTSAAPIYSEKEKKQYDDYYQYQNIINKHQRNKKENSAVKKTDNDVERGIIGNAVDIAREYGNLFLEGVDMLGTGAVRSPEYLYDLVAAGVNKIFDITSVPWDYRAMSSRELGEEFNFHNRLAEHLEDRSEQYREDAEELNPEMAQGFEEAIRGGDYALAARNLGGAITGSIPASAAIMTSPWGKGATIALATLNFGSLEEQGMVREGAREYMSDDAILVASGIKGFAESFFENFLGAGPMGKAIGAMIKSGGKQAAKNKIKGGLGDWFTKMVIQNPKLAMFGEMFEEVNTQIAQNAVDKYSGYKPDTDLFDHVIDAGAAGFGMGGIMSGGVHVAGVIGKNKDKYISSLSKDQQIELESILQLDNQVEIQNRLDEFTSGMDIKNTLDTYTYAGMNLKEKNAEALKITKDIINAKFALDGKFFKTKVGQEIEEEKKSKRGGIRIRKPSFMTKKKDKGVVGESGTNKYAEWITDKISSDKSIDEIIFDAIMNGDMSFTANVGDYKSKFEAYKKYEKEVNKYLKSIDAETKEQFKNSAVINDITNKIEELRSQVRVADKQGKDTDLLYGKLFHMMALKAFKTGTTKQLSDIYNRMAENNKDESVKEATRQAISEITELEKIYNESQEFANSDEVFHTAANQHLLKQQIGKIEGLVSTLERKAIEKLDKMKGRFDADYKITDKGFVFTGKQATEFKEAAIATKELQNYNNRRNDKSILANKLANNEKALDGIINLEYQQEIRGENAARTDIRNNYSTIFGSESVSEFYEKLNKVLDNHELKADTKEKIIKSQKEIYDNLSIQQQRVTDLYESQQEITVENDLRNNKIIKIADQINPKNDKDTDAMPADISSLSEEQRRILKEVISQRVASNKGITFSGLIERHLGLNDYTLTDQQRAERKELTEHQFNAFAEGWKANGYADTDFSAVYKKYFGKQEAAKTGEEETFGVFDKILKAAKAVKAKMVTNPVDDVSQGVTQEEMETARNEAQDDSNRAARADIEKRRQEELSARIRKILTKFGVSFLFRKDVEFGKMSKARSSGKYAGAQFDKLFKRISLADSAFKVQNLVHEFIHAHIRLGLEERLGEKGAYNKELELERRARKLEIVIRKFLKQVAFVNDKSSATGKTLKVVQEGLSLPDINFLLDNLTGPAGITSYDEFATYYLTRSEVREQVDKLPKGVKKLILDFVKELTGFTDAQIEAITSIDEAVEESVDEIDVKYDAELKALGEEEIPPDVLAAMDEAETTPETIDEIEKVKKIEKKETVKVTNKKRLHTLRGKVKAWFKVFNRDKQGKWTLTEKSNVAGHRLTNPNRFNHGTRVEIRYDPNDISYRGRIVVRENGKYVKRGDAPVTITDKKEINKDLFELKYGFGKSNAVTGTTRVERDGDTFTFTEDLKTKGTVEYKTYDQRPPSHPNKKYGFVTDDFFVTNDADFAMLNDESVEYVLLEKVKNVPSAEGTSTITIRTVDKDGNISKQKKIDIANEIEQNSPIKMVDKDGVALSWIETPQSLYLVPGAKPGDVRDTQKKLVDYRQRIVNGEVISSVISQKRGDGYAKISETGQYITDAEGNRILVTQTPINEQDPTAILAVNSGGKIIYNGEPFEHKKRKIINKEEDLKGSGLTFELRKIGTDESGVELYIAFQAVGMADGAGKQAANSIIWTLKAYLTQNDTNNELRHLVKGNVRDNILSAMDTLQNKNGKSVLPDKGIRNFKGVKDFMAHFTITDIPKEIKVLNPETGYSNIDKKLFGEYVQLNVTEENMGQPVMMVDGSKIYYAVKGRKVHAIGGDVEVLEVWKKTGTMTKSDADTVESLINELQQTAHLLKRDHKDKAYAQDNEVAYFDDLGNVTKVPYQQHQKNTLSTEVKGWEFQDTDGNTFYTTMTNTYLELDIGDSVIEVPIVSEPLSKELPETKTPEKAVKDNPNPERIKLYKDGRNAMALLGVKNVDRLFGRIDESEDNNLGEQDISEIKDAIETIPGVTASQKYEMAIAVMNNIIVKYNKSGKKLNKKTIIEEVKKGFKEVILPHKAEFEGLLNNFKELRNKDVAAGIDVGDINRIISEFEKKIQMFDDIKEKWDEIASKTRVLMYKYLGLSVSKAEEDYEKFNEGQDRIYSQESVEISVKDSIPSELRKFMAGILNKDSSDQVIRGFVGLDTYIPFDDALNTVLVIIGSEPKANMTYGDIIETLARRKTSFPFLSDLITKLNDSPQDMKNKFMYHMTKHTMSMKYMMYEYNSTTKKYDLKIYDTNSSELEKVIYNEWRSALGVSDLVTKNDDGEFIISMDKAKELLREFKEIKNKFENNTVTSQELIGWLKEFGIDVSNQTMLAIMNNKVRTTRNQALKYTEMFSISGNTDGIFGGLAYMLEEYMQADRGGYEVNFTKQPQMHPFTSVNTTIKNIARIESSFSPRAITISFMDGDKSLSGFIAPTFATDRIEDLKYSSKVRKQLGEDPYSSGSMLLSLLEDPRGADVEALLSVDHVGIRAMRRKGKKVTGDNNSLTKLPVGDQEVTKQGFFGDMNQGKLKIKYKGIKTRMARMMFPTMSDKKQMLVMNAPVLDLSKNEISYENDKLILSKELTDVVFEQLVMPEVKRIHSFHKGGPTNIEGYDNGAQTFMLIPGLNNLTYPHPTLGNVKVIKLMKMDPGTYNAQWFIDNMKIEATELVKGIINRDINKKIKTWNDNGIVDASGQPVKLSNEYFVEKGFSRDIHGVKLAAADFVINHFISLSNTFQLVAGDIAYYSTDKAYKNDNFGIDRSLVTHIPEMKTIFGYTSSVAMLDKLVKENKISVEEYKDLMDKIKPLPYETNDSSVYIRVNKTIGTNLGKRLALAIAPGNKVPGLSNYRQIFLNDTVDIAGNIDFLVNLHYGKEGVGTLNQIRNELSNKPKKFEKALEHNFPIIKDFFGVTSTDAQEFTTVNEHLDILFGQGKLTEEDYNRFKEAYAKGETIEDTKDLTLIFQPSKPVYTGSTFDEATGRMRMNYVKSSSYPLVPGVTVGTELNNLRVAIEKFEKKEGINVRAGYKTAAKVGATVTGINAFEGKEGLSQEALLESSQILDRRNFRIQQDTPMHALDVTEDEVTMGTQLMKLLFGDGVTDMDGFALDGKEMTGRQLLAEYNKTYGDLIQKLKAELFDELGLDSQGNPVDEMDFINKLSKMLINEAKARNYPEQDVDGLQIVPEKVNGQIVSVSFRNSIWLSTNSVRYEALLNSLITKKLVKLTLPGYSYIAGSQKGYEIDNTADRDDIDKSLMIYTKHWDGQELRSQGVFEREGIPNKAQIFVPSRFRNSAGELIDLFEGTGNDRKYIHKVDGRWQLKDDMVSDELLHISSFRIPTSSHVSASDVEIAGFLPPQSGDLMIVPKEFAIQKGLDYDVDKEFSYHLWHMQSEDGKVVPAEDILGNKNIGKQLRYARKELKAIKEIYNSTKVIDDESFEEVIGNILDDTDIEVAEREKKIIQQILTGAMVKHTSSVLTKEDIKMQKGLVRYLENAEKRILQNKIVKINSAVLSNQNPEMQRRINKVLSMDSADKQADMLQDEETDFETILSDTYQTMKMNLGAMGQMGIGVYSNYVVFNSLVQQLELPIVLQEVEKEWIGSELVSKPKGDASIIIGDFKSNGMLGRYINILSQKDSSSILAAISESDLTTEEKQVLENKVSSGKLTFNEVYEVVTGTKHASVLNNIRTLSEVFAERQNTATDNEKAQIMGRVGVDASTINIDSLLVLLGFDKGDIITDVTGEKKETFTAYLLISQPIVKEYVRLKNLQKANINDDYKSDKEIVDGLIKKYGGGNGAPRTKLTSQTLYNNIKKKAENNIQVEVLKLFKELEDYGRQLSDIQQFVGITKEGLDQSIFNTLYLRDAIQAVDTNKYFKNATGLIGDYLEVSDLTTEEQQDRMKEGYIRIGSYLIKPDTMMGHMSVNAVSAGHNLWDRFFPYSNPSLSFVMDNIMAIHKQAFFNKTAEIDLKKQIVNEMRKYLNSNQNAGVVRGDPEAERKRLFTDEPGNPSIAAYLLMLRQMHNPLMASNPVLKSLQSDTAGKISKVKYDNTSAHQFDEETLYHGFFDLVASAEPLPDLASTPNPANFDATIKFNISDSTIEKLNTFEKTMTLGANNKNMTQGETKVIMIGKQRMKVTYLGNITKNEYDGNFIIDNAKSESKWSTNDKEFNNGQPKHVFKFSPVYTTRDLAADLAAYAMLSGGVYGSIDFSKYIPLRYLEMVGYVSTMNSINIESSETFYDLLGQSPVLANGSFITQFFQHNPDMLPSIKPKDISATITSEVISAEDVENAIIMSDEKRAPGLKKFKGKEAYTANLPMMFTMYNKSTSSRQIYLLNGEKYIRVPETGVHGMSEYDITKTNINSVVDKYRQSPVPNRISRSKPSNINDAYDVGSGSITVVLENISERADSLGRLAEQLLKINLDSIFIGSGDTNGKYGTYESATNTITVDNALIETGNEDKQAENVLHEVLHAATVRDLNQYFDNNGNPVIPLEKMPEHIQELYSLFTSAKEKLGIQDSMIQDVLRKGYIDNAEERIAYGFKNVKEFVSLAMTSREMKDALQSIKIDNKTLLDKFADYVKKMLQYISPEINGTMLEAVNAVILQSIDFEFEGGKAEQGDILAEARTLLNERKGREIRETTVHNYNLDGDIRFIEFSNEGAPGWVFKVEVKVDDAGKRQKTIYLKRSDEIEYKPYTPESQAKFIEKYGTFEKYIKAKFGTRVYESMTVEPEKKVEPLIKEGIGTVFEQNPELAKIGTQEQYNEYLDTVFPESKVKDVVYHGTTYENLESFDFSKTGENTRRIAEEGTKKNRKIGFYFTPNKGVAKLLYSEIPDIDTETGNRISKSVKIILAIINIKNIKEGDNFYKESDDISGYGDIVEYDSYRLNDANQVHILGSEKDVQGFKEFVNKEKTTEFGTPVVPEITTAPKKTAGFGTPVKPEIDTDRITGTPPSKDMQSDIDTLNDWMIADINANFGHTNVEELKCN